MLIIALVLFRQASELRWSSRRACLPPITLVLARSAMIIAIVK